MKNLTKQLIRSHKQTILIFAGLVAVSLLFVFLHFINNQEPISEIGQVSDNIPSGFAMIPVELQNDESIRSLIQSHAVVDLYKEISFNQFHRLAQAVRMVRLSTNEFYVLLREEDVSSFLKHQSDFHAVVQNSQKRGSQIYLPNLQRRKIIVDHDIQELLIEN